MILTSVHKDEDGNYHAVEGGLQDGDMMIICAAIASRKNKTTRSMHNAFYVRRIRFCRMYSIP